MPKTKTGLHPWVTRLRKQNMPVLGTVIAEINSISDSEESNANQLAEVILRDPNLTSHVLRLANSVQYNYSKSHINTVSRAIVLIGLQGMRTICISLLLIESLLGSKPKERMVKLIAQGFHAATQAKKLMPGVGASVQEEVFIAGLLFNLGEMAFWAIEDVDIETSMLLSDNPALRKTAMDRVLGTSFKAITRELSKHWTLGETLEEALFPRPTMSPMVHAVVTGERISRASLFGWDSPQFKKVVVEVAELKGISVEQAIENVRSGAEEAAKIAQGYGVSDICPLVPYRVDDNLEKDDAHKNRILVPNSELQLNILYELSIAAREHTDVNTIFQIVLEGMHRGIGLERVCIAFVDERKLKAKYMLGEGSEHWRSSFLFDVGPYADNIFTFVLENGGAHWFNSQFIRDNPDFYPDDVVSNLGALPSFTFVLQVGQRRVAVFYADRGAFGGKLDKALFDSFKHFATQAQLNLNHLSNSNTH